MKRIEALIRLLGRLDKVYPDIDILAHEYVCVAPNSTSETLANAIADWATEVLEREWSQYPRLAASACLTIGKFGNDSHIGKVQARARARALPDTVFRQQALVVLASKGRIAAKDLADLSPQASLVSSQHVRFLRALFEGEAKAVNMSLNLLQPVKRTGPSRFVIRPRMLLLSPILETSAHDKLAAALKKWGKALRSQRRTLRDFTAERILGL